MDLLAAMLEVPPDPIPMLTYSLRAFLRALPPVRVSHH